MAPPPSWDSWRGCYHEESRIPAWTTPCDNTCSLDSQVTRRRQRWNRGGATTAAAISIDGLANRNATAPPSSDRIPRIGMLRTVPQTTCHNACVTNVLPARLARAYIRSFDFSTSRLSRHYFIAWPRFTIPPFFSFCRCLLRFWCSLIPSWLRRVWSSLKSRRILALEGEVSCYPRHGESYNNNIMECQARVASTWWNDEQNSNLPGTIRATDNEQRVDNGHVKFDNELVHYHLFRFPFFSSLTSTRLLSNGRVKERGEGLDKALVLSSRTTFRSVSRPSTSVEWDNETRGCHPPPCPRQRQGNEPKSEMSLTLPASRIVRYQIQEIVLQRRLLSDVD